MSLARTRCVEQQEVRQIICSTEDERRLAIWIGVLHWCPGQICRGEDEYRKSRRTQPTVEIVVVPIVQRRAVGTSVRAEQSLGPDMK